MALAPRLDLRQSQSLVMTPQLQQAIKLLALSSLEIEAFIAEEVERNPVLEAGSSESAPEMPLGEHAELSGQETAEPSSDDGLGNDRHDASEALDVDFSAETFHHDTPSDSVSGSDGMLGLSGNTMSGVFDGDGQDFDSFAARDLSLRAHLITQAGSSLSGRQLFLVQQIIEQIEPTGYLGEDLLAMAQRLGAPMAEMENALAALQRFDRRAWAHATCQNASRYRQRRRIVTTLAWQG
jgi:RNA polymerase sigma-54 factor